MNRLNTNSPDEVTSTGWLYCALVVTLSSMAGGLAWGIRGQYGHETGAMISGVLVGFTLTMLLASKLTAWQAAQAVSLFAIGVSMGGAMTYGQTVGLTHDRPFIESNNVEAFWWGMTGLAVKGGVWIGLGAAMFGMGLSGKRYRPLEMFLVLIAMLLTFLLGVWLLNRPFDAIDEQIPKLYFSHYSYWAEKVDKPRQECWGGFLFALITLVAYLGGIKRDSFAALLGLWGTLGGALGFPLGQSLQAANAWHPDWFANLPTHAFTQYFTWWNTMETTFGMTFGAIVGFAAYVHRGGIQPKPDVGSTTISPPAEQFLLAVHVTLLVVWNFSDDTVIDLMDKYVEQVLVLIIIPALAILIGRYWPFMMAFPIVLLPIAGKTVRELVIRPEQTKLPFENWIDDLMLPGTELRTAFDHTQFEIGWIIYLVVPVYLAIAMAVFFSHPKRASLPSRSYSAWNLLASAWLFFGLNFAFFNFPWPWLPWGGRTANAMVFTVFLVSLSVAALWFALLRKEPAAASPQLSETE